MPDDKTLTFEAHRRTLEGIAYRMLGTLSEARDVVQETYLKWHAADASQIDSARAWLITVCSRIALNVLQSARHQREIYVGEWLPEPWPDATAPDASAQIELHDSVSFALLVALEKLNPVERAVFLLHDVFDLDFDEVARIVGKSSANCRQLATRARKQVRALGTRFQPTPEEHHRLLEGFMLAARQLDAQRLLSLLAQEVELYTDSGGKVQALQEVLHGAQAVADFFVGLHRRYGERLNYRLQQFNGSLGALIYEGTNLATALTIEVDAGHIRHIYAVRNPDKLHGVRATGAAG